MDAPDLADLDAFAAVATARSFRLAARRRGVSASTLSEAVRRLEARMGARLLHRTTRSVTATDIGRRMLERLAPALNEVRAAVEAVRFPEGSTTGTLRLNVPTVVAELVLSPILARFLQRYPGITVEVTADDDFIDVLAAGFDAGVRYDERLEQDMIAVPIGPRQQCYVTVAAPAYWAARGRPNHPKDLLDHVCIRHRFVSGATAVWEFERAGERIRIDPPGPLVANNSGLERRAAIQGLGVIHTFDGFAAPALAAGELERVLPEWSEAFPGPFLYFAGRRHVPPPLRALVDFLREPERSDDSDPVIGVPGRRTPVD
jgi:DNA-binding transcriptional LysR family regulator